MSADGLEFFRTPAWCVDVLIDSVGEVILPDWVCDPACGDGAILEQAFVRWPWLKLYGAEIDSARWQTAVDVLPAGSVTVGDGLSLMADGWLRNAGHHGMFIANPPYSRGYEFVTAMLNAAGTFVPVASLMRLSWIEGARKKQPERLAMLRETKPWVGVLSRRPSFMAGPTDASPYAWIVWNVPDLSGGYEILECP